MSAIDIVKDLNSAVKSIDIDVYNELTDNLSRTKLNLNYHILDLSYSTLLSSTYARVRTSLSNREQLAYDSAHEKLITVLRNKCAGRIVTSVQDPRFKELIAKWKGPILIYNGDKENVFLVGKQFKSLQDYYSANIAEDPLLKSTRFGKLTKYEPEIDVRGRIIPNSFNKITRIKTEFGHIPTKGDENLVSPLSIKFERALSVAKNPLIKANIEKALDELYKVQASITHRFHNVTPEAVKATRDILGTGYVVVTLQSIPINAKFSVIEASIKRRLLKSIAKNVDYTSIRGSNTIKEDIVESIINILSGNKKSLKVHKPQLKTSKNINITNKNKVATSTAKLKVHNEVSSNITSITNLQVLLQERLSEQVRKNMGTGNDKKILNYRSGRFANSASVERISESRAGMVSIFYNYMRNPYATFSEGGKQQYPRSRDPKLLISKSIRELAMPIVGSRMRAVLV